MRFMKLTLAVSGIAIGLGAVTGCENQGMTGQTQRVALKFAAAVGDQAARCNEMYSNIGTTGATGEILDFKFYVSNVRLINAAGEEVPVALDQDGQWQVSNVAMLDFEDGSGACADTGNAAVNSEVIGTVPVGEYDGVVFDVGVPFDMNHDDLASAPAPLNVSSMFWVWAIGHKFVRVDFRTDEGVQWNMHLGSTMCESGGPMEAPVSECGRPNIPTIRMNSFDPESDTVVMDLAALLASSDVNSDTPDTASGCQTFPDDVNECTDLFPNLGLDFSTGRCIGDCGEQSVFRVRSVESSDSKRQAAATRGATLFETTTTTAGGESQACALCHGSDGSGAFGPDIRSEQASHLREHSQGDGPHPEGIKFTSLTAADYDDLAAFLASICEADPECMTDEGGEKKHDHG